MEEISHSLAAAVVIPVTKDSATREKEDNGVEAEEELGIFQLLDRLEEVTSMLTSSDKNQRNLWCYHFFSTLYVFYVISLNMYFLKYLLL